MLFDAEETNAVGHDEVTRLFGGEVATGNEDRATGGAHGLGGELNRAGFGVFFAEGEL